VVTFKPLRGGGEQQKIGVDELQVKIRELIK